MLPTLVRRRGDLTNWFDDFENLFHSVSTPSNGVSASFPRVDIHEDDHNTYLEADLPGLDKQDVTLRIEDNVLTLSGKRDDKREEKKTGYYRLERQTGAFERSFHLGDASDPTKADAEFKNGVLTVTIPKKEESKPKELEIKVK